MRTFPVHIIDPDASRRNSVARTLYELGAHAEIYESFTEFESMDAKAGIVMLYISSRDDGWPEMLANLRHARQYFVTIAYDDDVNPDQIVKAMHLGAIDYLHFPIESEVLRASVRKVLHTITEKFDFELKIRDSRELVERLTPREHTVLEHLVSGMSYKESAAELGLSPCTVRLYRANLYKKLDARCAADVVRTALYSKSLRHRDSEDLPDVSEAAATQA